MHSSPGHADTCYSQSSRFTSQPPKPVNHEYSSLVCIFWSESRAGEGKKRHFRNLFQGVFAGLKKQFFSRRFKGTLSSTGKKIVPGTANQPQFCSFHLFFSGDVQNIASVHHRKRATKKSTIVRGGDGGFEASPWGSQKQPASS